MSYDLGSIGSRHGGEGIRRDSRFFGGRVPTVGGEGMASSSADPNQCRRRQGRDEGRYEIESLGVGERGGEGAGAETGT